MSPLLGPSSMIQPMLLMITGTASDRNAATMAMRRNGASVRATSQAEETPSTIASAELPSA